MRVSVLLPNFTSLSDCEKRPEATKLPLVVSIEKIEFVGNVPLASNVVMSAVVNSPTPPALTASVAPSATVIAPGSDATFATCKVPALTTVPPVKELVPESSRVPVPVLKIDPPTLERLLARITLCPLVSILIAWLAALLKREE